MIIDCHTHAFPDSLAQRAMPQLEKEGHVKASLDGRISSLLRSMDEAAIDQSIVLSIATRPEHYHSILKWSKLIASDRLVPFPSIHPDDPQAAEKVDLIVAEGFKGIKMHPYYQNYYLDEERVFGIYERIEASGLVLLCHTGFDIAYERVRRADPQRIVNVIERFPRLKFVTTHFGAWDDWDLVHALLLGKPVYMDVSYSMPLLPPAIAQEMLKKHPADKLLFGSDSPWAAQGEAVEAIRRMSIDPELKRGILGENARKLLDGV